MELIRPVGRDSLTLNPDVTFRLDVDDFLSRRRLEDYVGGFLPAFSVPGSFEYDQWLEKTRTALRDEYLLQLDAAAKSALADGRETDAERFWQRYLQEEPLCETVSVSLMELYRARRDYNRAALVYRSLHKAMSDWLGITPLKETSALYYSIMEEWNARADPEDQRSDDFLVGRQEQLQSLFQLFPGPGSGRRRQSFVLLGEAGVGKSHLLAHFLAHGAVSDAQIVTTSCFKSKQEEYLYPWQAVMLSIASYIRKEDIPIPTAYRQAVSALFPVFGSGEGSVEKKAHMLIDSVMSFDSVLMILSLAAEKRPLLLVLEDIQWMDKISADLLDQLLHKADSSRILFAATCRQPSGPVATPLLRGLEEDGLYYSVGCFCIYRGLYQEGLDAIRRILDDPAAPVELLDLAHEQMTFYGIQTYQTQVMREHIQIALALTQGRDSARYAVNRRYQGYLLVMENRYEEGREELLRSLMLLRDGVTDDVELRLQSAYAHDYIGEAYRKQGSYEKAIGEYQMAIQTIGTFPTSTSKPMFYVNWAQAALAQADYAAARQALAQADRATGYLKEPSGYFQTLFCVYSALKGKAGVFEPELLHRLDLGSADPLPGLLQVTEN